MKRIAALIEEHEDFAFDGGGYKPREPKRLALEQPTTPQGTDPLRYQAEVFNFLISHQDGLGIRKVFQLNNASADGELELSDGRRVLLEIKYRMNWEKACQAGWQLLESLKLLAPLKLSPIPYAGLVFFEKFKGDGWDRKAASRPLEDGWYYWYAGHHRIRDDFSAVLVHFEGGVLETYPELPAEVQAPVT